MILDIDHHLDARQVRRQRSPVRAPLGAARRCRSSALLASVSASLLAATCSMSSSAEQQLIFRQRLGPAAEAMTLQLLDDLAQPLGSGPLRQQHRLQRAGIVGKRVRYDCHGGIQS
jgi:hypothetical protein